MRCVVYLMASKLYEGVIRSRLNLARLRSALIRYARYFVIIKIVRINLTIARVKYYWYSCVLYNFIVIYSSLIKELIISLRYWKDFSDDLIDFDYYK